MKVVLSCVILIILSVVGPAAAQTCIGSPSFRDNPYQVGVGAQFTDGARGVGGTFAAGGDTFFAGAGISVLNYTGPDVRSTDVSVFGGAELLVSNSDRVFLCPVASVFFGVGPDIGPVDVSAVGLQAGGRVGVVASQTAGLMVIPTFGLSAIWQRTSVDFGAFEDSTSDSSGQANVGVGFVFNRDVAITPEIIVPFSAGGSDVVFSLTLTFNFGR